MNATNTKTNDTMPPRAAGLARIPMMALVLGVLANPALGERHQDLRSAAAELAGEDSTPRHQQRFRVEGALLPDDEGTAVPLSGKPSGGGGSSSAQTKQFSLAAQPAAKLGVSANGLHTVSQPALAAAGFDVASDPRTFQLFADGAEVPISVGGESDGRFDAGDSVSFYGTRLDTPSTGTRVYWLVATPGSRPLRIARAGAASGPLLSAKSFQSSVVREDRTFFFSSLQNGDAESFFGPAVYTGYAPVQQTLTLSHVDTQTASDASITVALQGGLDDYTRYPDHLVQVLVNGTQVGEVVFEGLNSQTSTFPVSNALLREGVNTVTLAAAGGPNDYSLVDSVKLTYWHTYEADGDRLELSAPKGSTVKVKGFSSASVRVFDITNPAAPGELTATVTASGGAYDVSVTTGKAGSYRLLAIAAPGASTPTVTLNESSSLNAAGNAADMVLIARASMLGHAQPLVAHRAARSTTVMPVRVEDIYDEFSYGAKDPAAIRSFLSFTKSSWTTAPRFVLLLGDASFDPRNYLGHGDRDLVPTKLVATQFLKTASDDWFSDFDGDGVADLATGRLPAQSAAEAGSMVAKILAYENATEGDWTRRALLVAGDGADGNDFEGFSESMRAELPAGLSVQTTYAGQIGNTAARAGALQAWTDGPAYINYSGHGQVQGWTNILSSPDAYALTNAERLPFVSMFGCLAGFFHDVYTESLAEAAMRATTGGAVAVFASSSQTFLSGHTAAGTELARQLASATPVAIGNAVISAKKATTDQDVRKSFLLFGDPSMDIRLQR